MSPLPLVIILSSLGVDAGWQPLKDGGFEYTVQIEPQQLRMLKPGEYLASEIPPQYRDIRRIRVTVGTEKLARTELAAAPETKVADAHTNTVPKSVVKRAAATEPIVGPRFPDEPPTVAEKGPPPPSAEDNPPPVKEAEAEKNTNLTVAKPATPPAEPPPATTPPAATPTTESRLTEAPPAATSPTETRLTETPPNDAPLTGTPLPETAPAEKRVAGYPKTEALNLAATGDDFTQNWPVLAIAAALAASIGANLFLAWVAYGAYGRYRALARRTNADLTST